MTYMKLFTRRFVKDLFLIFLFGILFYILTHNPITHPLPKETNGLWSIQLMQQPLIFGIAGHNFLTLRDGKNTIVEELHGLPTDAETGTWKYIGTKATDHLYVWNFKNSNEYITQKNFSGKILLKGNKETVLEAWNKGNACKEEINAQDLFYPPYGVNIRGDTENSNSIAYTLMLCMGLDTDHLGLITPGWGKNLLDGK